MGYYEKPVCAINMKINRRVRNRTHGGVKGDVKKAMTV